MNRGRSGVRADAGTPPKEWLISDATLLALHRQLLRATAKAPPKEKGIDGYAAARIAVWFDLKASDTVIESAGAPIRDALGCARRNKAGNNRRVVIAWDGATVESWYDALESARAESLPMVFVREVGNGRQSPFRKKKGRLRPGEELPCITVDGHDVVAAYRVAHEAIERGRRNRGPTLIRLATYKIGSHAFTDPVIDMENYLRGRGLLKTRTSGPSN